MIIEYQTLNGEKNTRRYYELSSKCFVFLYIFYYRIVISQLDSIDYNIKREYVLHKMDNKNALSLRSFFFGGDCDGNETRAECLVERLAAQRFRSLMKMKHEVKNETKITGFIAPQAFRLTVFRSSVLRNAKYCETHRLKIAIN